MAAWMIFFGKNVFGDPYPYALMLLVIGGIFQALAMVAIMVGTNVLSVQADAQAQAQFRDTEMIKKRCSRD